MYIAFEKNKMFEPESRVMFLGEDFPEAIINLHGLHQADKEAVWVLAQIIDEQNSPTYGIVQKVLALTNRKTHREISYLEGDLGVAYEKEETVGN